MAEPVRKEELTTADLVRDARKPEQDRGAEVAGEPIRERMSEAGRNMPPESRAVGPQPVIENAERRVQNADAQRQQSMPTRAGEMQPRASEMQSRPGEMPGRAQDPQSQAASARTPGPGQHATEQDAPLFSEAQTVEFRSRWSNIQTGFVDEPRKTVAEADKLVASLMTQLAEGFSNERTRLEKQWDRGDDVSTEDLRVALKRYRSFFDRLLKA